MNTKNGPSWSELIICTVILATLTAAIAFDQGKRSRWPTLAKEMIYELREVKRSGYLAGYQFAVEALSRRNAHIGPLKLGPGNHSLSNCVIVSIGDGVVFEHWGTNTQFTLSGGHFWSGFMPHTFEDVWERSQSTNYVPRWPEEP